MVFMQAPRRLCESCTSSFRSFVRPILRAHFSFSEVGVCGVYRPRERILPLAGENDDDRENDEPEHEQLRRKRRPELEYAGC